MKDAARLLGLAGRELPVIQAPMAGVTTPQLVVAVSKAGGLGSLAWRAQGVDVLHAAANRIARVWSGTGGRPSLG